MKDNKPNLDIKIRMALSTIAVITCVLSMIHAIPINIGIPITVVLMIVTFFWTAAAVMKEADKTGNKLRKRMTIFIAAFAAMFICLIIYQWLFK